MGDLDALVTGEGAAEWRSFLSVLRKIRSAIRVTTLVWGFVWAPLVTLYQVDFVDRCGRHADLAVLAGLLLAALGQLWWTAHLVAVLAGWRRRSGLRIAGALAICAVLWSPLVVLWLWRDLPDQWFLDRHEARMQEAVRTKDPGFGEHFEHGSCFRYSWMLWSDAYYVLVYEPDRPAGSRPLGRDTDRFAPGILDCDRRLRGDWYLLIY